MGKKKVSHPAVNQQPTGFDQGRDGLVGDLQMVAQGASLILIALNDHFSVDGSVSNTVTSGLAEALGLVADEVELYLFEKPVEAGAPEHELYVLEKRAASLREKIAREGRRA